MRTLIALTLLFSLFASESLASGPRVLVRRGVRRGPVVVRRAPVRRGVVVLPRRGVVGHRGVGIR